MASIVKANSSLTAGGLAVLRRQYSTTDDGTLNYEVDYCCLAKFANNHAGRFRTGAQPPTAIPSGMSLLRLSGTPTLYDCTIRTQNGLTYFEARYSAASSDPGEVITTETSEQRNFSANILANVQVQGGNFGTLITLEGFVSVTFDYISTTVRVEAKNPNALPSIAGTVGPPFNKSIGTINGATPLLNNAFVVTLIETTSISRSSRGVNTYSKTSTGTYEANVDVRIPLPQSSPGGTLA